MKKYLNIIIIATIFTSCGRSSTEKNPNRDSSVTINSTDTTMDSISRSMSPLADGTVGMRQGKMMVVHDSGWMVMTEPVTCGDGCRVLPNGQVIMKNGDKMQLKEGETVDKGGRMMDKNGKAMIYEKMDSMYQK